jgi:hypothetical protein
LRYGLSGKAGNVKGELKPGGNPFEAPRRDDYPQPPLEPTQAGLIFKAACEKLGYKPFIAPSGNSSGAYTNPDVQVLRAPRLTLRIEDSGFQYRCHAPVQVASGSRGKSRYPCAGSSRCWYPAPRRSGCRSSPHPLTTRQPSTGCRLRQKLGRTLAFVDQVVESRAFVRAQPHNLSLDGNLLRGTESPPSLGRHGDSEKLRQIQ